MSVAGGVVCGLAWTSWYPGLILLAGLVPFFLIEQWIYENPFKYNKNSFFIYALPGLVLFSIIGMGWMRVASMTGAICVILGLALLMDLSLWFAHLIRLKAGNTAGFIAMITIWMTYEFISLHVNIVSPWLNLGNGLAKDIKFIQWYDLTGTGGGTLWILCSNLFLTIYIVKKLAGKRKPAVYLLIWLLIIVVPAGLSWWRYVTIKPGGHRQYEVVIIQPDFDPYTEKYTVPFRDQLSRVTNMAAGVVSPETEWIITPETTIDDPVNLDDFNNNDYVKMIREFLAGYPASDMISGMVSYRKYRNMAEAPTVSARVTDSTGVYYDHFNSAFKIDTGRTFEVYHKSKLVPGIEMQFAGGPGRFISRILPYLGGTKWGYGFQDERTNLTHSVTGDKVAPVICYESVFGSYVSEYVKNGAGALFIITNDGWWKNTNGYLQHLYFASLRAIETRRPVARAANTGISCLIDIRGKRTMETGWWKPAVLKGDIVPESTITTYVRYGDYLLKIALLTSVIIVLTVYVAIPFRKKIRQA